VVIKGMGTANSLICGVGQDDKWGGGVRGVSGLGRGESETKRSGERWLRRADK